MEKRFSAFRFSMILALVLSFPRPTLAESLSPEQQQALTGAIQQLTDPDQRSKVLKADKKAAASDQVVKEVGGEFSEEIYQLAGKVMESLVQQTHGDPQKMEEILEKAKKDPASFAKTFNSDQLKTLQELGKKIEKANKKNPSLN
jgi:hypothetical protein